MLKDHKGARFSPKSRISRKAAVTIVILVMASFGALLAAELTLSYRQQIDAVRKDSENLSSVIEGNVQAAIQKIDVVLGESVRAVGPAVVEGRHRDVQEINRDLLRLMAYIPEAQGYSLRVVDAEGKVVYNAGESAVLPDVTVGDRAYFLRHKNDPAAGLVISEPLLSRFTGIWLITLSRRINGPDGQFAGLVQAALRTEFFQGLFEIIKIGPYDNISLFDLDMRILSRQPVIPSALGKQFLLPRARDALAAGKTRTSFRTVSPVDHLERLFVMHKLSGMPYVMVIGRAPDSFLAAWWRKAYLYALAYLGMVAALAAFMAAINHHQKELEALANIDELTGLANRRVFDAALSFAHKVRKRTGRPLSVMVLDLDHFKRINDTLGHLRGDDVLRRAADVIRRNLRESDLLCRWGGEEFIVLMDGCPLARARIVAEAIRRAVETEPMAAPDDGVRITISIGVAETADGDDPDLLIAKADQALYQAKEFGRNRVWPIAAE